MREVFQTPKQKDRSNKVHENWRQCEDIKSRAMTVQTVAPEELPVKSERVNMKTVGVTSCLFPQEQPHPQSLCDRCPLSVAAGHAEDNVAFQTEPQHIEKVWILFRCTDQALPSVSLNHALQISCSSDIWTIQRMDLWRLSSTSTQPWHQLREPFPGTKTTLWCHHAQKGGAATSYFLFERQAIEQCMLGKRLESQSVWKS